MVPVLGAQIDGDSGRQARGVVAPIWQSERVWTAVVRDFMSSPRGIGMALFGVGAIVFGALAREATALVAARNLCQRL